MNLNLKVSIRKDYKMEQKLSTLLLYLKNSTKDYNLSPFNERSHPTLNSE